MFSFHDPTGSPVLAQANALGILRQTITVAERQAAAVSKTTYVARAAFEARGLHVGIPGVSVDPVKWLAYPRLARSSDEEIDRNRIASQGGQDEYTEWAVTRDATGRLTTVTFTTEFAAYWWVVAHTGLAAVIASIQELYPGAKPTSAELFGVRNATVIETMDPQERANRFEDHLPQNPWNNGEKGILCLTQPTNTLGALYGLLGPCAVPHAEIDPADMCAHAGGNACLVGRNSDPRVCQACQIFAQEGRAICLNDPVGIRLSELGGTWKVKGQEVDINDPAANRGAWRVSRNGRRGVLDLTQGVLLNDMPVEFGAQVAAVLQVAAEVLSAPRERFGK